MYTTIERNEIRRRRSALILAIFLHLGLAAFLYLFASEKPDGANPVSKPAQLEKYRHVPQPKAVNIP